MPIPTLESLLGTIEKHWPFRFKKELVGGVIIFALIMVILVFVDAPPKARVIALSVTVLCLVGVSFYARRVVKTKKDKIGFVISVAFDDESVGKKIREDFVFSLRNLLKAGKGGSSFQIIEMPNWYAQKVLDIDDAQHLRLKTKAHFVLYGRVRLREFNKQDHHFIDLNGIVTHRQIDENISQLLAAEFSELLPRQVIIPKENDLVSFQFTSEWTEIVAKYIIGIAASLSGDLRYAEQLHRDVLARIGEGKQVFPVFAKLRERIPLRLSEIAEARGLHAYSMWRNTREERFLDDLHSALNAIGSHDESRVSVHFLFAIFFFLRERNVAKSLECLSRCHSAKRDATWYFNVAFLNAYKGSMPSAVRNYRKAISLPPVHPSVFAEIEEFLSYVASTDSQKFQLFYCLGFLNWKVKGDTEQAITDFSKFLESGDQGQFPKERELTRTWLNELDAERIRT